MKTTGLANIGNTCSVSALLQCLAHTRALRKYFTQSTINMKHSGRFCLTKELIEVLRRMWRGRADDVVVPDAFLAALYEKCGGLLRHGEQHDVCELYTLLCDKVAQECYDQNALAKFDLSAGDMKYWNDINPKYAVILRQACDAMKRHNTNYECEWLDKVQGVVVLQTQCRNSQCNHTCHNFEPFTVLSIEFPDNANSLGECLDAFFQQENVDDWNCEKCKGRGGNKMIRIWKMPRIFAVSLKRFGFREGVGLAKNGRAVDIPQSLSFAPDSIIGPQHLQTKSRIEYFLSAVALHHGNIWGGHYTAVCRSSDDKWIHCDDTSLEEVPHPNVSECYMMLFETLK